MISVMTVRRQDPERMSLKSRGLSPANHGVPGRGGSVGPGHGSTYSSEAEEVVLGLPGGSNNTSPSHTLAGHATSDTSNLDISDRAESNSIWYDEFDSSGLDPADKQKYLDQFQVKINKIKEQIKREQLERDSNVDEYLR